MADFTLNPTDSASYNDAIYAAIITDRVLDALMAAVVTPPLLAYYDLRGQASKAVDIPKADAFTAAAVAEGVELTNTELTTTKATLTASEVGFMATVTDVLEVSDIPAAHGARLRQIGRAMADKLDVDVCALFGGFSTVVGATTVNLSLDNILDAIFNLEAANAPKGFVGGFHPRQTADFRLALKDQSVAIFQNDSSMRAGTQEIGAGNPPGYFGNWFEIDFYQSTNVPTANLGADRAGGIFSRDYALGLVEKWSAKVVPMYWPPLRAWVLAASAMYGVGEIEDSAGVSVITDA